MLVEEPYRRPVPEPVVERDGGYDDVIAMDGRMLDELSKAQVPVGHATQVRVVEDDCRPQTRGRPAGCPVDPAQEVDEREEPEEAAGVELVAQALPRGQLVGSGRDLFSRLALPARGDPERGAPVGGGEHRVARPRRQADRGETSPLPQPLAAEPPVEATILGDLDPRRARALLGDPANDQPRHRRLGPGARFRKDDGRRKALPLPRAAAFEGDREGALEGTEEARSPLVRRGG